MRIDLLCSLLLATVFAVEAVDFCSMNREKMTTTLRCMGNNMPTRVS